MNLAAIAKPELVLLAVGLGLKVAKAMRTPEIIKAIETCGSDADEISECWSEVQRRRKKEDLELEMLQQKVKVAGEASAVDGSSSKLDMRSLLQPFCVGGDLGLYLINFERTSTKMCFERSSWPQRLLNLLPAEVADVMARLDPAKAEDYSFVKSSLLRMFRLSPEAFRIKFRQTKKDCKESYSEFAYRLKGFLESWLHGANAFEDREKILEQLALEQFFSSIPWTLEEWIQDRFEVETIQKAADYADQYSSRRREVTDDKPTFARNQSRKSDHSGSRKYEPTTDSPTPEAVEVASDDKKSKRKSFEERKSIRCYVTKLDMWLRVVVCLRCIQLT